MLGRLREPASWMGLAISLMGSALVLSFWLGAASNKAEAAQTAIKDLQDYRARNERITSRLETKVNMLMIHFGMDPERVAGEEY